MILYTNGCSWTYGGSLEHCFIHHNILDDKKRLRLVWPHHLGLLLNADKTVNLAAGCGSNSRILRTTFDWLKQQDKHQLKDTVAVIQITEYSRFEIYDQLDHDVRYENIQERWLKCKIDTAIHTGSGMQRVDAEFIDLVNKRIAMSAPIEHVYNVLGVLYSLKGLFESYGIYKYYFWQLGHSWNYLPDYFKREIYNHFNILDDDTTGWVYPRISHTDSHPSIEGHIELSRIIYDNMKRKGL